MKLLMLSVMLFAFTETATWYTNLKKASEVARESHRLILVNFSGSDWCGPCIRLKKEIFDSPEFASMADTTLVLLNADFPRNKKNKLEEMQEQENEQLASRYNNTGKFPLTLILTPDGKVVKTWEGYPKAGKDVFIQEIKTLSNEYSKR